MMRRQMIQEYRRRSHAETNTDAGEVRSMPKFGAWIHDRDGLSLPSQIESACNSGLQSARSYSIQYSRTIASILTNYDMSLFAGLHVQAEDLLKDWRSQVRLRELDEYQRLGVKLEAICVGNELREFGDDPEKKRFTARVSFGLANVLISYREWLGEHGWKIPLTYAMEGIVLDGKGLFRDHVWPVIDACDIVSVNLYPMGRSAWHGPQQFEESRAFLHDARVRNNRLLRFEMQLRGILEALSGTGKPVILSETGFPSALGCEKDPNGLIVPISDNARYGEVLTELLGIIADADADYGYPIKAIYFYEWRDNLHHAKITNIEQSPIHCAFGLCDRFGALKFDLGKVLAGFKSGT